MLNICINRGTRISYKLLQTYVWFEIIFYLLGIQNVYILCTADVFILAISLKLFPRKFSFEFFLTIEI